MKLVYLVPEQAVLEQRTQAAEAGLEAHKLTYGDSAYSALCDRAFQAIGAALKLRGAAVRFAQAGDFDRALMFQNTVLAWTRAAHDALIAARPGRKPLIAAPAGRA